MPYNPKIFREYDIRGIADKDIDDSVLPDLSLALGTFLRRQGRKTITVGRDCRVSSPRISRTLYDGLLASGLDLVDVGLVPTPLLYFSVIDQKVDGGIMVTGSHNPPEHNGFKIVSGSAAVFGHDIQEIRAIMEKRDFASGRGTLRKADIRESYIATVAKSIKTPLEVKAILDCGNGMGGVIAGPLFRHLGAEVIELFPEPDGRFPNHHPDPTVPENLEDLVARVKKEKAVAGVAFDGDADRIGVVDATGRAIFGDELLVIYARDILRHHPGAKIISEVKASHRLFHDIEKHGGVPILWKTGHSLIKAKMKEVNALLAGEMSGHMFFNDRYYGYDDAIYAAARFYEIIARTGQTPCEMLSDLPPSVSTPEIRFDCSDDTKFAVVEGARKLLEGRGFKVNAIDGARIEFADGWGLVRASNTQPVLVYRFEATTQKRLNEIRQAVEGAVAEAMRAI